MSETTAALFTDKITIVVMSCDAYSDVWQPFAACWDRFWPDCPYPVYLVSETKAFFHSRIGNLQTGRRMPWGEMMRYVIDHSSTQWILYLQEDYLLRNKVDQHKLNRYFQIFSDLHAAYLRLLPWPGPDEVHPEYPELGLLLPNSAYRTSLQAALWDKAVLKSIVEEQDDGRFESWSIARANQIDLPFLCLPRNGLSVDINHDGSYPLHYYATAVFQGKWLKEAVRLYRGLGIPIDTSHRGVMNRIDFLEYHERKKGTDRWKYRVVFWLKKIFS